MADKTILLDTYLPPQDLAKVSALLVEIERLRAALEKIANDGKNCADHCRKQASRALERHAHTQRAPHAG